MVAATSKTSSSASSSSAMVLAVLAFTATTTTAAATASAADGSSTSAQHELQQQQQSSSSNNLRSAAASKDFSVGPKGEHVQFPKHHRELQAFDFYNDGLELCDNSPNPLEGPPELGPCDTSKFPTCGGRDEEQICYNRKFSRDHFHADTHQHQFYIQYDRVFCYPEYWGGCSSCTPGRYCLSEKRCILDEIDYPCAQW
eukprot:CAMPEP_0113488032 /NCGR_PEP_ID=MMETSP0014_2-20120614/25808_1 /TAXON_ID=2857 /ORGANISM="Nitzschia sp." /LENGTH=198 /DNA_ID=CAMNT_0000381733 /DNA_START=90 /DNA_END=683 /DNA_ORIENTATION=- /assembly_acc=CAM_ASM_000159